MIGNDEIDYYLHMVLLHDILNWFKWWVAMGRCLKSSITVYRKPDEHLLSKQSEGWMSCGRGNAMESTLGYFYNTCKELLEISSEQWNPWDKSAETRHAKYGNSVWSQKYDWWELLDTKGKERERIIGA